MLSTDVGIAAVQRLSLHGADVAHELQHPNMPELREVATGARAGDWR